MKIFALLLLLVLFVAACTEQVAPLPISRVSSEKLQETLAAAEVEAAQQEAQVAATTVEEEKVEVIQNPEGLGMAEEYTKLVKEKAELKQQYIILKSKVKKASYEDALLLKDDLDKVKNRVRAINSRTETLEQSLTEDQIADAKNMAKKANQWVDPRISSLSVKKFTTTDGVEYCNFKLLAICPIGIDIQHPGGIKFLDFKILPKAIQEECNYSPVAAYEYKKQKALAKKEQLARARADKKARDAQLAVALKEIAANKPAPVTKKTKREIPPLKIGTPRRSSGGG